MIFINFALQMIMDYEIATIHMQERGVVNKT